MLRILAQPATKRGRTEEKMKLIRWRPGAEDMFRGILDWENEGSRLFGVAPRGAEERSVWAPNVDVYEENGELVVRADVPGFKKDQVEIHVDDGILSVSGEKKDEKEEKGKNFYRTERSYGRFERRFELPAGTPEDKIKASLEEGVLTVRLPKAIEVKPDRKRITLT
ncbi:MAG: Hsp20/alpha crystallin family protein [Lentisphaerales bacterium]|nr:MAG: Hsp20/alpha crystallin family protein [Lentisphaerales bacterium]